MNSASQEQSSSVPNRPSQSIEDWGRRYDNFCVPLHEPISIVNTLFYHVSSRMMNNFTHVYRSIEDVQIIFAVQMDNLPTIFGTIWPTLYLQHLPIFLLFQFLLCTLRPNIQILFHFLLFKWYVASTQLRSHIGGERAEIHYPFSLIGKHIGIPLTSHVYR